MTRCSRKASAIAEFAPTMMHVKAMTVDGSWSIVGTANLDNRSLELNDELVVGVQDPALATTLRAAFDADLGRSTRLDLAAVARSPTVAARAGALLEPVRRALLTGGRSFATDRDA